MPPPLFLVIFLSLRMWLLLLSVLDFRIIPKGLVDLTHALFFSIFTSFLLWIYLFSSLSSFIKFNCGSVSLFEAWNSLLSYPNIYFTRIYFFFFFSERVQRIGGWGYGEGFSSCSRLILYYTNPTQNTRRILMT